MSNLSKLYIPLELEKNHVNRLLAKKMPPIELRENLKITSLKIDGEGDLFSLEVQLSGKFNKLLQIHFKPRFDKQSHRLILDDLNIEMMDKGLLSKGLNWMMQGVMQHKIEETIQNQLDEKLQEMVLEYINKTQKITLPEGLAMELRVQEFDILKMYFKNSKLLINTEVLGQVSLKSDVEKSV